MLDRIPNYGVGDSFDQIEQYVKNSNLDQKVKQSIFNFINEDREVGDGLISNRGELQILYNLLHGIKMMVVPIDPEKASELAAEKNPYNGDTGVYIKNNICGDPCKKGEDFIFERTKYILDKNENLIYNSYRTEYNIEEYRDIGFEGPVIDIYEDVDGDGTLDNRTYTKYHDQEYRRETTYTDNDADGNFDEVYSEQKGGSIKARKDENGNWKIIDMNKH